MDAAVHVADPRTVGNLRDGDGRVEARSILRHLDWRRRVGRRAVVVLAMQSFEAVCVVRGDLYVRAGSRALCGAGVS